MRSASAFPVAAAVISVSTTAKWAVRLQMALTYPFTAVLVLAYCPVVDCVGLQWIHHFPFVLIEHIYG